MKHVNVDRKLRRKMRVSRNIHGTSSAPRISVFRSSKYIYAQAIDDVNRVTLCSCSSKKDHTEGKNEQIKNSPSSWSRACGIT